MINHQEFCDKKVKPFKPRKFAMYIKAKFIIHQPPANATSPMLSDPTPTPNALNTPPTP